jgi:HAD superfamily hydrolase (TIGR01484 family)
MMSKYKLLALDLDGTLLNAEHEIGKRSIEWIRRSREAGITVILSTGRGYRSALPYAEQLELDSPMVTVNGGEIWLNPHEGTLHRRVTLDSDKVAGLHDLALKHPGLWYWGYTTEEIYNTEKWVEDIGAHTWLKFGYYSEEAGVLPSILEVIREWEGLELSNSSPFNIEVNPQGINKATAVEEVCRLIGCDMSEAVAVGDSLNDIEAIRACGLGVAMGNAQDEVKVAADVVTTTNLEDGVAYLIENYLLKA